MQIPLFQCPLLEISEVFVADDLGFMGLGIPDLVTELCPPQDTAENTYKSDRARGMTRPHKALVAQNGILGPKNPPGTSRSVTWQRLKEEWEGS